MESQAEQYHHQHSLPPPPPAHHQQQYPSQQYYEPSSPTVDQYQQPHYKQQSHHKPQSSQSSSKHRAFSFHGDKARKNSYDKENLHETAAQKEANRLHSKADPTLAISEAEPAEIAAMSENSLAPLRSIVHKDAFGNPIAEPDKSNPTRSRWERPLDTIRAFEAAIDGGYSRKSMIRGDSDSVANWNRRSSYMPSGQPRFRPDSYYGSRPVSIRPDGGHQDYNGAANGRNSIYEINGYNGGGHGYANGRQRPPRTHTEPSNNGPYGRDQNVYPLSHKDRSYETVTSAAGSGSSDPVGYQTDPTSSDNSSIERRSPAKRPEPVNDYGIGFSQSQAYQDPNFTVRMGSNGRHPLPPPPTETLSRGPALPRKEVPGVLRRQPTQQSAAPEKRKSWFSRRFSKNS